MAARDNEALLVLELATERGMIPKAGAEVWRALAEKLPPDQTTADWLVDREVLTAQQVADLRAELNSGTEARTEVYTDVRDAVVPPLPRPASPHSRDSVPEVEGYQITDRLGEGAMGVVWRAMQLGTRREVALKLLSGLAFGSETARKRFEREVELTARLEHPHIAGVYDSGVHHGVYYYAMELVNGVPLDRYVRDRELGRDQILVLMRSVCRAVEHAHDRGVVHRDLKPSNILVSAGGEPHIVDFGLAKVVQSDGEEVPELAVSLAGTVIGTLAYMAPEQAGGQLDQAGAPSDVYSLGAVLCELLTGKRVRDVSGALAQVLVRIADGDEKRPRELSRAIDPQLEALLLKAMSHEPEARYASAGALADDLDRYLNGVPLSVKPTRAFYSTFQTVRKHAVPLAGACTVILLLIALRNWGVLQGLELKAYDTFLGLRPRRPRLTSPITIVGITEDDIQSLGHYPITDDEMAELLEGLVAKGAHTVGVDIFRDIPNEPGSRRLADVLTRHQTVFAVMKLPVDGPGVKAPPALEGTDRVGFADQVPDPDGVIRRCLLFADDDQVTHYSLGLRLALSYLEPKGIAPEPGANGQLTLGGTDIRPLEPNDGAYVDADTAGYQFLFDYAGPTGFTTISLVDALNGRIDGTAVRDRIVLVGAMAESVGDFVSIPGNPRLHGVAMQGVCIDQLLRIALESQRPIRVIVDWQEWLVIAGSVVACCLLGLSVRSTTGFLLAEACGAAAILLSAYLLFCSGWWVPVVPPICGWVATWLLVGVCRPLVRRRV